MNAKLKNLSKFYLLLLDARNRKYYTFKIIRGMHDFRKKLMIMQILLFHLLKIIINKNPAKKHNLANVAYLFENF